MGYKGRDTKQSIKRGMSKGKGYPKGQMGFSLFIDKDNKIIFRKIGFFGFFPPPPPPPFFKNVGMGKSTGFYFLLTSYL